MDWCSGSALVNLQNSVGLGGGLPMTGARGGDKQEGECIPQSEETRAKIVRNRHVKYFRGPSTGKEEELNR